MNANDNLAIAQLTALFVEGKMTAETLKLCVDTILTTAKERARKAAPAKRKTKMVRNLMSGKMVEIDADTPFCCDPSTETYWSM